jgi:HK97 family phage major capsid protein
MLSPTDERRYQELRQWFLEYGQQYHDDPGKRAVWDQLAAEAGALRAAKLGHADRVVDRVTDPAGVQNAVNDLKIDLETGDFASRRKATLAHIRATNYGSKPSRKAPELISRMTEREVFDLARVRVDPMNRDALRGELIDRARRANEISHYPTAGRDQERVQEHIDDLLRRSDSESWHGAEVAQRILMTGSEAYRSAFAKIIASQYRGSTIVLSEAEKHAVRLVQEQRALAVGVGSTGGFAVPFQLDQTLIVPTSTGSVNPFRAVCRTETISGTNEWRAVTSTGMTASYATEASVNTDNTPTLAQPPFIVKQARAFAPLSLELYQDWTNILDQLGDLVQSAKNDLEATKFAVGTGTNEPEGVVTGSTNTVSTTAAFDLASDLYPVETALPARFRPNAVWFANRAQYQLIRQFVQPESTSKIIDHQVGGATEVIGYTAYEASGMINAVSSTSKIMVLFDPQYYCIVDRIGMDIEVTTQLTQQAVAGAGFGLPTGQRGILALWRNTAKLLDANASRLLVVA